MGVFFCIRCSAWGGCAYLSWLRHIQKKHINRLRPWRYVCLAALSVNRDSPLTTSVSSHTADTHSHTFTVHLWGHHRFKTHDCNRRRRYSTENQLRLKKNFKYINRSDRRKKKKKDPELTAVDKSHFDHREVQEYTTVERDAMECTHSDRLIDSSPLPFVSRTSSNHFRNWPCLVLLFFYQPLLLCTPPHPTPSHFVPVWTIGQWPTLWEPLVCFWSGYAVRQNANHCLNSVIMAH